MGVEVGKMAVVGDDIAAAAAGARASAVLVRTGKFRDSDLSPGSPEPDLVLDFVASLPPALGVKLR